MMQFSENSGLYHLHEMQRAGLTPLRIFANASKHFHMSPYSPLSYTQYGRTVGAACELLERVTKNYGKPEFGIDHVRINHHSVQVEEEVVEELPFGRLLHFKKNIRNRGPKLLIVAPMSGHHATLLRGTVQSMLPFADVFITDWYDARDVPLRVGTFDLDTYIDYVMHFIRSAGPDVHTMAVCQPSVPLLAAVALMSAENDRDVPKSMTLIGGPIDTREAPTQVNLTAKQRPLSWFEKNVVTRVPGNYPGFMRRVYPGFLQLTGFMTMNLERHVGEHMKLFQHLVVGDGDSADAHRKFYNEYLSVADLPADFYLQTIDVVFQRHLLPKGKMMHRSERVDPGAITKTALLTLEGELDDISGVGQTKAAHRLCKNIPAKKKRHHMEMGVGHYGIFNGRKFRENVVPIIVDHMKKNA